MSPTSGLLTICLCLLGISATSAIMCYHCNSEYDPQCADPFVKYDLGIKNCSYENELDHLPNVQATLCRKTTQKVYGEIRVWRGCGYVRDKRDDKECMKRSGTHDVQALYCSCTTDLCNTATNVNAGVGIALAVIAIWTLI
ncbi:uncharacterized protein LOC129808807 [Phlebotomus papatasi]|uniref:uncharacterized protein LOC129808807 n=1 Tax=Phlebotomus papatasi TaxID=29031 RepID=UPI0024838C0A|nr:uncharacterized protein LOC129808807 [Phlebotomus papatasi]